VYPEGTGTPKGIDTRAALGKGTLKGIDIHAALDTGTLKGIDTRLRIRWLMGRIRYARRGSKDRIGCEIRWLWQLKSGSGHLVTDASDAPTAAVRPQTG
jgi:hypothetical protein